MAAKSTKKAQDASEVKAKKSRKDTKEQVKSEEVSLSEIKVERTHMDSVIVGSDPMSSTFATPQLMALKPEELWKMRYFEAESRVSQRDAAIAQLTKKMVLMQIDPKGIVFAEEQKVEAAQKAIDESRAEYRKVMNAASDRLGVNLSGCAIDPDTGVVIPQN